MGYVITSHHIDAQSYYSLIHIIAYRGWVWLNEPNTLRGYLMPRGHKRCWEEALNAFKGRRLKQQRRPGNVHTIGCHTWHISNMKVLEQINYTWQRWVHAINVIIVVVVGIAPAVKKPVDAQIVCQERTDNVRMEKPLLSVPEWKNARTEKNKVANKPIPEDGSTNASQITIDTEENTMKVRSEKSRMTLKTVITADQEPVTERWSGTFHSLQRQPLPPSSGLKWMEKPLPIHLNVITKRLFT